MHRLHPNSPNIHTTYLESFSLVTIINLIIAPTRHTFQLDEGALTVSQQFSKRKCTTFVLT